MYAVSAVLFHLFLGFVFRPLALGHGIALRAATPLATGNLVVRTLDSNEMVGPILRQQRIRTCMKYEIETTIYQQPAGIQRAIKTKCKVLDFTNETVQTQHMSNVN